MHSGKCLAEPLWLIAEALWLIVEHLWLRIKNFHHSPPGHAQICKEENESR